MTLNHLRTFSLSVICLASATHALGGENVISQTTSSGCEGYGPQSPRDIDHFAGSNKRVFSVAANVAEMNLCNIHFHNNAEHKAKAFSIDAIGDAKGQGGGYRCGISESLSNQELLALEHPVCGGLQPGDTVEVHWVYSSCDVKPGAGLGACLTERCANPDLRVETQVFTLVNDSNAVDFGTLDYAGFANEQGLHQAKKLLPDSTGTPVEFLGSTTGPSFSEENCSPLQVGWSVRPQCSKLDIRSLAEWCKSNAFDESKAHGVRKLVTNPALLSTIQSATDE